jgi:hypothetical protein
MQRKWILAGLGLLAAVIGVLAFNVGSPRAAYQNGGQFQRWEYRFVSIAEGVREFNRLGADGWEVGGCMGAGQPQAVVIMKRPLP